MKVRKVIRRKVETELEITGATLLFPDEAEEFLLEEDRCYDDWWWLRSYGYDGSFAAYVDEFGDIHCEGTQVDEYGGCAVRPALKIKNLETSGLSVGDIFEMKGYEFKIISENLAWMYNQNIGNGFFNKDYRKGNDYENSDIKKYVDCWYEYLIGGKTE